MPRSLLRALFAAAMLATTVASAEAALRRVPLHRNSIISDYVGMANLLIHNVYGTPVPEIVSCSEGTAFALTRSGNGYRPVWNTGPIGCNGITAGDVNGDGAAEVIVGTTGSSSSGGWVYVFSPDRPGAARLAVQLAAAQSLNDVALGNVDGDPALEIVAVSSNDAYVYDAATLALEWHATGRGGTAVAIGDIEGDGPTEIVINGSTGHVLDAATQTLKWGYVGGFGSQMALGDVDNDGRPEIVAGRGSTITIINGDTLTSTSFSGSFSVSHALVIADGNNDGQVEIVVGDDKVHGFSTTGTELWYVTSNFYGISGVGIGDPDGDGLNEAVWGAGYASSGADSLLVANTATRAIEWQAPDLDGPIRAVAADVDGDGEMELVVAYESTESGYRAGVVQIQNMKGEVEGTLALGTYYGDITAVATGQLDSDPALEIAFLETDYDGGRIHVHDGVTKALEWSSPARDYNNSGGIAGSTPLRIANVDADPVWELIVATKDRKIQILNGASNFVQSSTAPLDDPINDLALADVNGDSVLDVVAVTYPGYYVFRASDLVQRFRNASPLYGYKRVAARNGEFALAYESTLVAFSGATNTETWRCTGLPYNPVRLRYANLGGEPYIAHGTTSTLQLYRSGGSTCPTPLPMEHPVSLLVDFDFADTTGDGVPELVFSTYDSAEVDAFGLSTAPRGDADGDGLVTDADLDVLSAYVHGSGNAPRIGADANGDFSITSEDLFYLINYRRGTGAPPP